MGERIMATGGGSRDLGELKGELLHAVRELGYRRSAEPFRLSSGGMSNDYVDLRRCLSGSRELALAAQTVIASTLGTGIDFDAIGGMTMGADPVAHAVALLANKSWFSVRKAEKTHGSRQRIEGASLGPGTPVVLFEDTTTTGTSILDALDVVLATGARIVTACTILDRGELARAAFERRGVPYLSLLTYRDLGIEAIDAAS